MSNRYMLNYLIILLLGSSFSLRAVSLSQFTSFPSFCQQAATTEDVFAHFKRHPYFREILEHVSREFGQEYLDFILKHSFDAVSLFDQFRGNDSIGDPIVFSYGNYGQFSPTTLRYIKTACDLRRQFKEIGQMHIVEIGGGYGGQCKILADLTGFASYTIIDLPEVIALEKKYLALFNIPNVHFIESKNLSQLEHYDLVISNYAFSEIDRLEQEQYLKSVILSTPHGYMVMNFINPESFQAFSTQELVSLLTSKSRNSTISQEIPTTYPTNVLLTWE